MGLRWGDTCLCLGQTGVESGAEGSIGVVRSAPWLRAALQRGLKPMGGGETGGQDVRHTDAGAIREVHTLT